MPVTWTVKARVTDTKCKAAVAAAAFCKQFANCTQDHLLAGNTPVHYVQMSCKLDHRLTRSHSINQSSCPGLCSPFNLMPKGVVFPFLFSSLGMSCRLMPNGPDSRRFAAAGVVAISFGPPDGHIRLLLTQERNPKSLWRRNLVPRRVWDTMVPYNLPGLHLLYLLLQCHRMIVEFNPGAPLSTKHPLVLLSAVKVICQMRWQLQPFWQKKLLACYDNLQAGLTCTCLCFSLQREA